MRSSSSSTPSTCAPSCPTSARCDLDSHWANQAVTWQLRQSLGCMPQPHTYHTVEYNPFIKSQLASHN